MYCRKCGTQVGDNDAFCSKCGYSLPRNNANGDENYSNFPNGSQQQQTYGQHQTARPQPQPQQQQDARNEEISDKNGLIVLILALFAGMLGVHSFYAGRTGIGIAQLFTLGGCGIWALVDVIILATGSYRDGDGKLVELK